MTTPCDLFTKIPKEELSRLFEESDAGAELDFSYLGFENIYQKVLEIAPKDMIILDLGCAYATQSWYFRDYAAYIGIDLGNAYDNPTYEDNLKGVIQTENSRFFFEPIQSFISNTLPILHLDLNNVFAVCSAVPDREARQMVKNTFPNYLDWYPGEEMTINMIKNNSKVQETYVKMARGEKTYLIPLVDYLDQQAYKYGFYSYKDLRDEGYSIDLPALYNKDFMQISESDMAQIMKELEMEDTLHKEEIEM